MERLYEMDPLERFSERAADYARYRPDYPDEAMVHLLEGLGDPRHLVAVDVGAGTGISSRRLAAHGVRVRAVEPNAAMRKAAEPHALVEFIDASAESIPLADGSVDLVACFQAFHWFRAEAALPEFHRILRRDGRLAVVWNERDHSDPFTREYGELVRALSKNHPAERREQTVGALLASPLFTDVDHATFRFEQRLSLDALIGRARSASYLPSEGEGLQELIGSMTALHEPWRNAKGEVTLVYRTEVYRGSVLVRSQS